MTSPPPGTPRPAVRDWEDEGGTIIPASRETLPKGVERIVVTRYRVGSYTYDNLNEAIAESRRLWPRGA